MGPFDQDKFERLEVLLEMHKYNSEVARQYFDYREKVTAAVMLVYAGITSIMWTDRFSLISLPLGVIMIIIARYAEFFVMKFYERSEYHFSRCRALRQQIDSEYSDGHKPLAQIFSEARQYHRSNFTLRNRARWVKPILEANTHDQWGSLHRVFLYVGLFLTAAPVAKAIYDGTISVCKVVSFVGGLIPHR